MALGTMTADAANAIDSPNEVTYHDVVSLAGDGAYATGGSTGFDTAFQALTKTGREILSVEPVGACGGYVPRWDYANKKLLVYTSNGAGPAALAEFTNGGNLSGTTFKLLVKSR